MNDLIYFIVGLIVLIVVIALLWQAGTMAMAMAPINPTLRTVLIILALVVLALIVWYLFGHYVRVPG